MPSIQEILIEIEARIAEEIKKGNRELAEKIRLTEWIPAQDEADKLWEVRER